MIEANRRNARRSTGPRTAAGKAHVRINALRHGGRSEILHAGFAAWLTSFLNPCAPSDELPPPIPLGRLEDPNGANLKRELEDERLGERRKTKNHFFDERSRQSVENKGSA